MEDGKDVKPPPLMGATAIRPPDRKGMDKYTHILYDTAGGETKILTRTPKSWALIIAFYIVYYSCLAGFWAGMMAVFLQTVPLDHPKWVGESSIIGVRPGIGVRPSQRLEEMGSGIYKFDKLFDGSPIADDVTDEMAAKLNGTEGYATRMFKFFQVYENNKANTNITDCTLDKEELYNTDASTFCKFKTDTLGETCGKFPYGYAKGDFTPCVFLKVNRIFGLKPKPILELADVDKELQKDEFVKQLLNTSDTTIEDKNKKIFIHCTGDYPADQEALAGGNMEHIPKNGGIPLQYFPFQTQNNNENALIALKFKNLKPGVLVHVICKAYYKGVIHSKKTKAGLVKFEVLVEDP